MIILFDFHIAFRLEIKDKEDEQIKFVVFASQLMLNGEGCQSLSEGLPLLVFILLLRTR